MSEEISSKTEALSLEDMSALLGEKKKKKKDKKITLEDLEDDAGGEGKSRDKEGRKGPRRRSLPPGRYVKD